MSVLLTWRPYGRLLLVLLLAGCSPAPDEEVAARVNGQAILAAEIDLALQDKGTVAQGPDTRQRELERLVVEELLAQQYLRGTPGSASVNASAQAVARRELLARRHVADLVNAVPPPSPEQIRRFYRDNPALYAQRRIFTVRQLDIAVPPREDAAVRAHVDSARSIGEMADWMQRRNVRFLRTDTEHASNELSPAVLAQLDALPDGSVALLDAEGGLRVIQRVSARPAPLDEQSAWPLIKQRLWAAAREAAVEAEVARLSRMAAIAIPDAGPRVVLPTPDDGPTPGPPGLPTGVMHPRVMTPGS